MEHGEQMCHSSTAELEARGSGVRGFLQVDIQLCKHSQDLVEEQKEGDDKQGSLDREGFVHPLRCCD
ncbi:hypothetical protein LEMLEM_LOCUS13101 [Lemmus lemmus]